MSKNKKPKINQLAVAVRLGGMSDAIASALQCVEIAKRGINLLSHREAEQLRTTYNNLVALNQIVDCHCERFTATSSIKQKGKRRSP